MKSIEERTKYHKKNRKIFIILIASAFIIQLVIGLIMGLLLKTGYFPNSSPEEIAGLFMTYVGGFMRIFYTVVLIWYGLSLEFNSDWWIYPLGISVCFLPFVFWIPFIWYLTRSRKLIDGYRKENVT